MAIETTGIKAQVLDEIRDLARKNDIQKVILFGSRARGDHRRSSDIDLAALGGNMASFALDLEEETSTLLRFDVVDLEGKLHDKLMSSIDSEGIVLYEKV